jgi:hypothetical protein
MSTPNKPNTTTNYWCCARCGAIQYEDKRRYNFKGGVRVRNKVKPNVSIKANTSNRLEHRITTVKRAIEKALNQPETTSQVTH